MLRLFEQLGAHWHDKAIADGRVVTIAAITAINTQLKVFVVASTYGVITSVCSQFSAFASTSIWR